jgi:DNA invertase Pin-like site-specific DNA recombinase
VLIVGDAGFYVRSSAICCRPATALRRASGLSQAQGHARDRLDPLARDVRFFVEVIDDSCVDIRFADLPDVCPATDEGRMILVSMANFAEFEGRRVATRTKAALCAAKARGVALGRAGMDNLRPNILARQRAAQAFADRLRPLLTSMASRGFSQREMVNELNSIRVPTARGGRWGLTQVQRVLARVTA